MSSGNLPVVYRPQSFDEVIGHANIIKSLKAVLEEKATNRAFLFSGQSGTGKTTLARIIAKRLDCGEENIVELDGASYTGIDDMRRITELASYVPFGTNKNRIIIIDECHRLSKQAHDSILKSVEETPHTYWCLLSSEPSKIPTAIKTRCLHYELGKVGNSDILKLLQKVADAEKWVIDKSILFLIAMRSDGSPRQALNLLSMCKDCKTKNEAESIIKSSLNSENASAIELCRALLNNSDWNTITSLLKSLEDQEPESVRLTIVSYMNKVALNPRDDSSLAQSLKILMSFMERPCYSGEKLAPITLACAKVILIGE